MKDKLITLKNNKKYVILEEAEYNNEVYYFANEIIGDDVSEIFSIFKIVRVGNQEKLEIVTNSDIIKKVCAILDKKIE